MLAGEVIQAPAAPAWQSIEETDQTVTSTSPVAGSPICGLTFVAPRAGLVLIQGGSNMQITSGTGVVRLGWRLRSGSTVGSGTLIDGTETGDGTHGGGVFRSEAAGSIPWAGGSAIALITGLTAGATYNVAAYQYVSSGAAIVYSRSLFVFPLL